MERGGSAGREYDKEEIQGAQLNVVFHQRAHPNHRVVEFHLVLQRGGPRGLEGVQLQRVEASYQLLVIYFQVECLGVRLAYRVVKGSGRLVLGQEVAFVNVADQKGPDQRVNHGGAEAHHLPPLVIVELSQGLERGPITDSRISKMSSLLRVPRYSLS